MALPSASEFFEDPDQDGLRQGDIVLSPSTVLWSEDQYPLSFATFPIAPLLGEGTVVGPLWNTGGDGGDDAPVVAHESRWGPVMVLSHDCEIEKEFNRTAAELIADGHSRAEAERIASADESLDRYILVAPLLMYSEAREGDCAGIRDGSRYGYFPIPPLDDLLPETFVNLNGACTVDRLLLVRFAKLASLSLQSVGVLRFKLSEAYAARDLSVVAQIEAAVGRRIENVVTERKSKKSTSVQFYLDDGKILHLEVRSPKERLIDELRRLNPLRFLE